MIRLDLKHRSHLHSVPYERTKKMNLDPSNIRDINANEEALGAIHEVLKEIRDVLNRISKQTTDTNNLLKKVEKVIIRTAF